MQWDQSPVQPACQRWYYASGLLPRHLLRIDMSALLKEVSSPHLQLSYLCVEASGVPQT